MGRVLFGTAQIDFSNLNAMQIKNGQNEPDKNSLATKKNTRKTNLFRKRSIATKRVTYHAMCHNAMVNYDKNG